ncbi:hypothetical protein BHM03_00012713 [Ensete ventricosum]|nr:hypothetical protein BHM03_00012713 [Ensete ventricosum]
MDGSLVPRHWGWLLEWWSSGQEEAPQVGSGADSCKEVGSGAYIVGVVGHPYLATLLSLWLTMPSYTSPTPAVLAVRHASTGKGVDLTYVRSVVRPLGIRPYLCQVGRKTAGAPILASDQLPAPVCARPPASLFLRHEVELVWMSGDPGDGSGVLMLEWRSPGGDGVVLLGSAACSCKEVGSGRFPT